MGTARGRSGGSSRSTRAGWCGPGQRRADRSCSAADIDDRPRSSTTVIFWRVAGRTKRHIRTVAFRGEEHSRVREWR
jgi:hypothetical protein